MPNTSMSYWQFLCQRNNVHGHNLESTRVACCQLCCMGRRIGDRQNTTYPDCHTFTRPPSETFSESSGQEPQPTKSCLSSVNNNICLSSFKENAESELNTSSTNMHKPYITIWWTPNKKTERWTAKDNIKEKSEGQAERNERQL